MAKPGLLHPAAAERGGGQRGGAGAGAEGGDKQRYNRAVGHCKPLWGGGCLCMPPPLLCRGEGVKNGLGDAPPSICGCVCGDSPSPRGCLRGAGGGWAAATPDTAPKGVGAARHPQACGVGGAAAGPQRASRAGLPGVGGNFWSRLPAQAGGFAGAGAASRFLGPVRSPDDSFVFGNSTPATPAPALAGRDHRPAFPRRGLGGRRARPQQRGRREGAAASHPPPAVPSDFPSCP